MNAFTLATASIRTRPLQSSLSLVAIAAGIALICALFLLSNAISAGFARNAQGIDMIIGAKGSPLQLVLSSVYHADIPAGNIEADDYHALLTNKNVKSFIPLVLGDSYKGFRMVGTTPDYIKLYKADLAQGDMFKSEFQAVAGANTNMQIGQKFAVSHGFAANSNDVHDAHLYTISGILKPTGTVLDKLLISTVKSVQDLHAGHHHHHAPHEEHEHEHDHKHHGDHEDTKEEHEHDHAVEFNEHHHERITEEDHDHEEHHAHEEHEEHHESHAHHTGKTNIPTGEITAAILKVRSPVALMNLPRQINQSTDMIAAVPSYEIARLSKNLGLGRQIMMISGAAFIALSMLILWATLSASLSLRKYDLAILRVLGASPATLSATILAEACILSLSGAALGMIAGHTIAYIFATSLPGLHALMLPSTLLQPGMLDLALLGAGALAGLLSGLIPALMAGRTNIAALLAKD